MPSRLSFLLALLMVSTSCRITRFASRRYGQVVGRVLSFKRRLSANEFVRRHRLSLSVHSRPVAVQCSSQTLTRVDWPNKSMSGSPRFCRRAVPTSIFWSAWRTVWRTVWRILLTARGSHSVLTIWHSSSGAVTAQAGMRASTSAGIECVGFEGIT